MSKRDNHWYIIDTVVQALGRSMKPRAWMLGLWVFLVAVFVVAYRTGALDWLREASSSPTGFMGLAVGLSLALMAFGLVLRRVRQGGFRARYAKALTAPTPEPLMQVLTDAAQTMQALPDADALVAHEKALGYSLYGAGAEATGALAGVAWESKADLIRGIGMNAEGLVELLCRRNARRALELTRQARALTSVSASVPGASQSERYHHTCVSLCEVILDAGISSTVSRLEEGAANDRFPALQLLATLGLAVAMERSGNTVRAGELRDFLRSTAPHCAPLHLKAEDFTSEAAAAPGRPVVAAQAPSPTAEDERTRAAKRKLVKGVGMLLGFWALMLVLYLLMYSAFSKP